MVATAAGGEFVSVVQVPAMILLRELRVCGEVVRSIADRNHSQLALITIYLQMRSIYLVVRDFAEEGRATDLLVAPLRVFVSFVIFVLR
jgi:hypothetical protein